MNVFYLVTVFVSLFSMYLQNKEWPHYTKNENSNGGYFETKKTTCPSLKPCYTLLKYDVKYRCGSDQMCTYGYKCCRSDCYIHRVCVEPVDENDNHVSLSLTTNPLPTTQNHLSTTKRANLKNTLGVPSFNQTLRTRTTRSLRNNTSDFATTGHVSTTIEPFSESEKSRTYESNKNSGSTDFYSISGKTTREGVKQDIDNFVTTTRAEPLVSKFETTSSGKEINQNHPEALINTLRDKPTTEINKISERTSNVKDSMTTPMYLLSNNPYDFTTKAGVRTTMGPNSGSAFHSIRVEPLRKGAQQHIHKFKTTAHAPEPPNFLKSSTTPMYFYIDDTDTAGTDINEKKLDSDVTKEYSFSGSANSFKNNNDSDMEFSGSGDDMEFSGSGDEENVTLENSSKQDTNNHQFSKGNSKEFGGNQRTSTEILENVPKHLDDGVDKFSDKNESDKNFSNISTNESRKYRHKNKQHSMTNKKGLNKKIKNEQSIPKESEYNEPDDEDMLRTTPVTLSRPNNHFSDLSLDEIISGSGSGSGHFEDDEYSGSGDYQITRETHFDQSGSGDHADDVQKVTTGATLVSDNDSDLVFSEFDDLTKTITNFTPNPNPSESTTTNTTDGEIFIKNNSELEKNSTKVILSYNRDSVSESDKARNFPVTEEAKLNLGKKKTKIHIGAKEDSKIVAKEMFDMLKESSFGNSEENSYDD